MLIAAAKEPQFVHGKDIERLIRKQEARLHSRKTNLGMIKALFNL